MNDCLRMQFFHQFLRLCSSASSIECHHHFAFSYCIFVVTKFLIRIYLFLRQEYQYYLKFITNTLKIIKNYQHLCHFENITYWERTKYSLAIRCFVNMVFIIVNDTYYSLQVDFIRIIINYCIKDNLSSINLLANAHLDYG